MNASQFSKNSEICCICHMEIKYNAEPRNMHAKKKTHIRKSSTDFASNRRNAVVDKFDSVKQRRKFAFFLIECPRVLLWLRRMNAYSTIQLLYELKKFNRPSGHVGGQPKTNWFVNVWNSKRMEWVHLKVTEKQNDQSMATMLPNDFIGTCFYL